MTVEVRDTDLLEGARSGNPDAVERLLELFRRVCAAVQVAALPG